jgi:hypothetical protein
LPVRIAAGASAEGGAEKERNGIRMATERRKEIKRRRKRREKRLKQRIREARGRRRKR